LGPYFSSHIYRVAIKKPVGILHVNVVRAVKLLKMDLLGTSDPYVKLSLTGDKLPAKKTTIKRRNLNPQWNEKFKIVVKDPQSQVLQLQVYDWDKVLLIFFWLLFQILVLSTCHE
jgi:Ca2+-dependent lipid-binding protein